MQRFVFEKINRQGIIISPKQEKTLPLPVNENITNQ